MNRIVRVLLAVFFAAFSLSALRAQTRTPATVTADRTNLRAQPGADAEILGSLQKGDRVEVLGEVTSSRPKEIWSRVALPAAITVWAYGPLVDKAGHVKGETLNYRAGPGRNYSILGQLARGDTVTVIREFDGWLQIEAPAGAVAYIASRLLDTNAPATNPPPAAAPAPAAPAPEVKPAPVAEPPPSTPPAPAAATPATETVVAQSVTPQDPTRGVTETSTVVTAAETTPSGSVTATADVTPETANPPPNSTSVSPERPIPTGSPRELAAKPPKRKRDLLVTPSPAPALPMPEEAGEARTVTREGIVRATLSPQAPSDYELRDGFYQEGLINYLYLVPQKDLRKFSGKRVKVTGKETLDSRWRTPVLQVESIELAP